MPRPAIIVAAVVVAALLVAGGLLLAGSDSPSGPFAGAPADPPETSRMDVSAGGTGIAFAYPRDWDPIERGRRGDATTLTGTGPRSDRDVAPAIQARLLPRSDASFESNFETNKQITRLSGGEGTRIASERTVELEGATEARLVEYRYELGAEQGTDPTRLLVLFAQTEGGGFVTFGVSAPESTGLDPLPLVESARLADV